MKIYTVVIFWFCAAFFAHGQQLTPIYYDIGSPRVNDYYVDPQNGSDSKNGKSKNNAFKTLTAAWNAIPGLATLSTGYRINILPGTLSENAIPNYLESKWGTFNAPIIIRAAEGAGTAILTGDLNVFDVKYLYLIDLTISPNQDAFHCEQCDHLLIRGGEYNGGQRSAHETIKINQSSHVYIENSNIHGAGDNAIDFVAVQYGHIIFNRIHNAEDWCAYVKGGSAYIRIEGNQVFNCGTGGITAGQGTGFEFMVPPWIHYEAYDIKIINNIIHDTQGAGIGINGGYNVLAANNTLYKVGSRSHLIEVVYGLRSCDGNGTVCTQYKNLGGWGTTVTGTEGEPIGNKNIFLYNNIVYNPNSFNSPEQLFAIYGPRVPAFGTNLSSPQRTDVNLVIKGNLIWNNPHNAYLGIEESNEGCQPSNQTCNQDQLSQENSINIFQPQLKNPSVNDFRPSISSNLQTLTAVSIPSFSGNDRPAVPSTVAGNYINLIDRDRGLAGRDHGSLIGAYSSANSTLAPAGFGGSGNGGGGNNEDKDNFSITRSSCSPKRGSIGSRINCQAKIKGRFVRPLRFTCGKLYRKTMKKAGSFYKARLNAKKGKCTWKVSAKNLSGIVVSKKGSKLVFQ